MYPWESRNTYEQRTASTGGSGSASGGRGIPQQGSAGYAAPQQGNWDPRAPSGSSRSSPTRTSEWSLTLAQGSPFSLANVISGEYIAVIGIGDASDLLRVSNIVGSAGSAVGLDNRSDVLASARFNPAVSNSRNIFLILTQLPDLSLPRASVDAIIISSTTSFINLVRDSERGKLFQEFFRILKPGGRFCASSLVAKNVLPEHVKDALSRSQPSIDAANPSPASWYDYWMTEAGFTEVTLAEVRQSSSSSGTPRELARAGSDSPHSSSYYPHWTPAYSSSPPPTSGSWGGGAEQSQPSPSSAMQGVETSSSSSMSIQHLVGGGQTSTPQMSSSLEPQLGEWIGVYNMYALKPLSAVST